MTVNDSSRPVLVAVALVVGLVLYLGTGSMLAEGAALKLRATAIGGDWKGAPRPRVRGGILPRPGAAEVGRLVARSAKEPDMNLDELETTLAERGWLSLDLPDPSGIFEARDHLLEHLRDEAACLQASRV